MYYPVTLHDADGVEAGIAHRAASIYKQVPRIFAKQEEQATNAHGRINTFRVCQERSLPVLQSKLRHVTRPTMLCDYPVRMGGRLTNTDRCIHASCRWCMMNSNSDLLQAKTPRNDVIKDGRLQILACSFVA